MEIFFQFLAWIAGFYGKSLGKGPYNPNSTQMASYQSLTAPSQRRRHLDPVLIRFEVEVGAKGHRWSHAG